MIKRFHSKKIYIDFLERVLENQNKEEKRLYANHFQLVLSKRLKHDFGYSDAQIDDAKEFLIKAGRIAGPNNCLYITDDGKKYLKEYGEFLALLAYQKVAFILKKHVQPLILFISSITGFPFVIHKLWNLF